MHGVEAHLAAHRTAVVIEDDVETSNDVMHEFRQAGFTVYPGLTGLGGVERVRLHSPSVVTVNVGLPDIDGFEVLRRIRSFSNCYVVVVSSRATEHDVLTALQSGADDYVYKPIRARELRARVDVMLRRPRIGPVRSDVPRVHSATFDPKPIADVRHNRGELTLDCSTRTVKVGLVEVSLTRSEFDLLREMFHSNGAVCSKFKLLSAVWGEDLKGSSVCAADQRAIDVHMGNLRRKLSLHLEDVELITTVRGIGYRIASPSTDGSPRNQPGEPAERGLPADLQD